MTKAIHDMFEDPKQVPAILLIMSIGILGAALMSQYVGGLRPCELCISQRYPYAVTIVLATTCLLALSNTLVRVLLLAVMGIVFFYGAYIALFHVGVEQGLWSHACSTSIQLGSQSVEEMAAALFNTPVIRCDEAAWSLFGISMAGYNAIASLGLGTLAAIASWRVFSREL